MKSKPVRFGRAIVLSILFFLTVFSLFGNHDGSITASRNAVHIWTGSLLLIGSAVHLGTNLDWVKAVFSRPAKRLKKHVRQNRRTDLGIFISGMLCTITGLLWLLLPQVNPNLVERWNNLHAVSGVFMILLLGIHLVQHWEWMANTARQMRDHQPPKADEQAIISGGAQK